MKNILFSKQNKACVWKQENEGAKINRQPKQEKMRRKKRQEYIEVMITNEKEMNYKQSITSVPNYLTHIYLDTDVSRH